MQATDLFNSSFKRSLYASVMNITFSSFLSNAEKYLFCYNMPLAEVHLPGTEI